MQHTEHHLPHPAILKIMEQEQGQEGHARFFDDGAVVQDFLSFFSLPVSSEKQTREMIAQGESGKLEFKSTLRWDMKAGKTNPAVERASLKTICAFLNATGGTLLIGVRDDGSIEGIESDKLLNDDRFLLHLWTLIRTCLGRDVSHPPGISPPARLHGRVLYPAGTKQCIAGYQ
jgi:Putative DNA-binding domain